MKAFNSISKPLKSYYGLAKPERTLTNVLTALAGFLFASEFVLGKWFYLWLAVYLLGGLTLIIGSANVLNNYIDKDLDQKMARTKKRALPSGQISARASIIYATALGLLGFWLLLYTNWLTIGLIAAAYFWYVAVYGYAKRHTVYSTLIGTVPGGASIVAGYTAYTGKLDLAALILFLMMLGWQMVHFYAIAIYRLKDYKAARIPTLPVRRGLQVTKKYMLVFTALFIFAVSLLKWEGYTGYIYLTVMLFLGLIWLQIVMRGFTATDSEQWAKAVFKFSLVVLLGMCLMVAVGPVLP
ncbi:MAG TPA: heme o synthase [Candidatus Saccharimonadales bacterium]